MTALSETPGRDTLELASACLAPRLSSTLYSELLNQHLDMLGQDKALIQHHVSDGLQAPSGISCRYITDLPLEMSCLQRPPEYCASERCPSQNVVKFCQSRICGIGTTHIFKHKCKGLRSLPAAQC